MNLVGQVFGRLTVLAYEGVDKHQTALWLCRCECGIVKVVPRRGLRSGGTVSCGCYGRERAAQQLREAKTRHGHAKSPTHITWCQIVQRCTNPRNRAWKNYGGRGITVCARWRDSFEAFLADMGERPDGLSIERVDNNRGYEPGNCIWATANQQARNKRTTRLSVDGVREIRARLEGGATLDSLAAAFGVCRSTIVAVRDRRIWDQLEHPRTV